MFSKTKTSKTKVFKDFSTVGTFLPHDVLSTMARPRLMWDTGSIRDGVQGDMRKEARMSMCHQRGVGHHRTATHAMEQVVQLETDQGTVDGHHAASDSTTTHSAPNRH